MTLRALRFEGDPVLLANATPVAQFDDTLAALVRDMFETMYKASGRGLAAPQVGISKRVFVMDTAWKEADPAPMIFVNPKVMDHSKDMVASTESCLSIPGKTFGMQRPSWVTLAWQDLDGVPHQSRFEGVQAICVCHEHDHLDGILISQAGAAE